MADSIFRDIKHCGHSAISDSGVSVEFLFSPSMLTFVELGNGIRASDLSILWLVKVLEEAVVGVGFGVCSGKLVGILPKLKHWIFSTK